jgi:hypothetical protein
MGYVWAFVRGGLLIGIPVKAATTLTTLRGALRDSFHCVDYRTEIWIHELSSRRDTAGTGKS